MVTIEDVAKKADTSIATVSRVLNKKGGYSEKTKEIVDKAIEDLDYESNAIARSLKKSKTNTIGVLVPDVSSMLANQILNGIEKYASSNGYSVLTSHTHTNREKVMESLKTFQEQRVDGLIFVSDDIQKEYYDYVTKMDVPIVLAATEDKSYPISFIKVNDFEASYDAVSYLISMGHENISMISGRKEDPIAGKLRVKGYQKALENTDLKFDKNKVVFNDDFTFKSGRKSFSKLIKKNPETTAIFAASDELAVGALNKANELNMSIPDDISIVGYDNIMITKMVWPPLTTVSQPLEKIGYLATKQLIQEINHGTKKVIHKYVKHEIVERNSVMDLR